MNRFILINSLLLSSIAVSPCTLSDENRDIADLKQRIAVLENAKTSSQERASWTNNMVVSGSLEFEASYEDRDSDSSTSDLVLAAAELGIDATVTDHISALVTLLYEEDGDGLDVDIATASYSPSDNGFSFALGQDYLPFGAYQTALVNDPLALDIGEARETTFIINYETDVIGGALYIFNGDKDEDGKDKLVNYGARLAVGNEIFSVGLDYLSNLADSDGLQDNNFGYATGADVVDGASVYGSINTGTVTIMAEHLSALDDFSGVGNGSEPSASQFELAVTTGNFTYALSYQQTDESVFIDLPEERLSVGFSTEILDGISLGAQFQQDEDYSVADGGSGNTTNAAVLQLAAEF